MLYCLIDQSYKLRVSNGPEKPYSTYSVQITDEDETHLKGTDRDGILRIFSKSSILSVNEIDEGVTDDNKKH